MIQDGIDPVVFFRTRVGMQLKAQSRRPRKAQRRTRIKIRKITSNEKKLSGSP